jgi:hypothetical protein
MDYFKTVQEFENAKIIYQRILKGDPVLQICDDLNIEHVYMSELFTKILHYKESLKLLKIKEDSIVLEREVVGFSTPNWTLENLDIESEDLCVGDAIRNPEILKDYEKTGIFQPVREREYLTESILFAVLDKYKKTTNSDKRSPRAENTSSKRLVDKTKRRSAADRKIKKPIKILDKRTNNKHTKTS